MNVSIKKAQCFEYNRIKSLFLSAFPLAERPPFSVLRKSYERNKGDLWSIYADNRFAGFCHTLVYDKCVYIFYLAIKDEFRGMGIGSNTLQQLISNYSGYKIFLALEKLDENAENFEERKKRHSFYEKNGLHDLPHYIKEATETYAIMGNDGEVTAAEYNRLIENSFGKFYKRLFSMQIVD